MALILSQVLSFKYRICLSFFALGLVFSTEVALAQEKVGIRIRARELLTAMGVEQDLEALKERMFQTQYQREPKLKAFQGTVNAYYQQTMSMRAIEDELIDQLIQSLNEEEMKQALAFYQTESGRKILNSLPKIRTKAVELSYKKGLAGIPDLNKKIREEYKTMKPSIQLPEGGFRFPR